MKRLFVQTTLNSEYIGPDHTPDIPMHVYVVTKVVDSIEPAVRDRLNAKEVDDYCGREDWTVTVT